MSGADEMIGTVNPRPHGPAERGKCRFSLQICALIAAAMLAGCITIPTEGQQGGSNVMLSYETWDAATGHRTSRCQIGRDALAAQAKFETVDVDSPCQILLEGVDQTQGDATLTGQALQIQAAQMTAVTMAVLEVLQTRGLIPQ